MKFSCLGKFRQIPNRQIFAFFAKKIIIMFKKILEVGNLMSSYKDCLNLNRDEIEHIEAKNGPKYMVTLGWHDKGHVGDTWHDESHVSSHNERDK